MSHVGALVVLGALLAGWVVVLLSLLRSTHALPSWWLWLFLFITMVVVAMWTATQTLASPGYGTDEAALDQWAAQLSLKGINPYAHSLHHSLSAFSVSATGRTFLDNGHVVTTLSYPALAFEIFWPFLVAGWSTQLPIALNVAFWLVTMTLLFIWLPRHIKPLSFIIALLPLYLNYVISGFSVILTLPLVVWAAHRVPEERRRRLHWAGSAILLGLAAAVNQWTWPVISFVVVSQMVRPGQPPTWNWSSPIKYMGVVLGAFLIPNLPFVIANFPAWWHGITYPITAPLVPAGQGWVLVALNGVGHLGPWHERLVILIFVVLLVIYAKQISRWESLMFFLPGLVLFWASRSFSWYWTLGVIPSVALVSSPHLTHSVKRTWRPLVMTATGVITAGIVAGLVTPSFPGKMNILSWTTGGPNTLISNITIRFVNPTSHALALPTFFVDTTSGVLGAWHPTGTPRNIPAHTARCIVLRSTNYNSMLAPNAPFRLVAVGPHGTTLTSQLMNTKDVHLAITAARSGRKLNIRVAARGRWNQQLSTGKMRIALTQVHTAPSGQMAGTARINGRPPGQSPVTSSTNQHGIATFHVQLPSIPQSITFQAYLIGNNEVKAYSRPIYVP